MTGRLVWHALDVGDEPDWGQRYDNGPRPEPGSAVDVTFRVADPEPADPDPDPEPDVTFRVTEPEPDPEPDWDRLRGDVVHVWQGPLEERGVAIRIDGDDTLVMKPMSLIPESDRKLIRRYKPHLLHLIRECFRQIPSARLVPTMDRHQ